MKKTTFPFLPRAWLNRLDEKPFPFSWSRLDPRSLLVIYRTSWLSSLSPPVVGKMTIPLFLFLRTGTIRSSLSLRNGRVFFFFPCPFPAPPWHQDNSWLFLDVSYGPAFFNINDRSSRSFLPSVPRRRDGSFFLLLISRPSFPFFFFFYFKAGWRISHPFLFSSYIYSDGFRTLLFFPFPESLSFLLPPWVGLPGHINFPLPFLTFLKADRNKFPLPFPSQSFYILRPLAPPPFPSERTLSSMKKLFMLF